MSTSSRFSISPEICYRLFYPQVPAILCAKHEEAVSAMPANSCISLSHSPALVGVSVRTGSKTEKVLSNAREFSLCWLNYSEKSKKEIIKLSSKAPDGSDKLKRLKIGYKIIGGVPVLLGSEAFLLCRKVSSKRFGDHVLFVGKVKIARASRDFTTNLYWSFEKYKPLLYLGSNKEKPFSTL